MSYEQFTQDKLSSTTTSGFTPQRLNPLLKPHQRLLVKTALKAGRFCIWADTGLGKALMALEWAHKVATRTAGKVLILSPLGAAHQLVDVEAPKFGYHNVKFIHHDEDIDGNGIYVTNYERLEKLDCSVFEGVVLDESSVIKNYTSKNFQNVIEAFSKTPYRMACSATPAPNDHIEIGCQCEFLGILSRTQMLAEYFIHDGGETQKWRLKGHAEQPFWDFVSTWAAYVSNPADLGFDGDEYILPPIQYHTHRIGEFTDLGGDGSLVKSQATGLNEQRKVRKLSLNERCNKAAEVVATNTDDQWLIWCETNAESKLLTSLIPDAVEVEGSQHPDTKRDRMLAFSRGEIRVLVTKPKIAGFGMNWQSCNNVVFVGVTHSFEQYYQAVRRCYRFGQEHDVSVHIIQHVLEGTIECNLKRKEKYNDTLKHKLADRLNVRLAGKNRAKEYKPNVKIEIPEWLKAS